ncbi:Uncharacterised protein [Mycobacteroides abscessus subsp. abscessus]|nr:Uncharacterised protein [Mycobacteroides abscessus subsp. abscessus]SKV55862.1 Uncharacterised protein [Mycobacteroides abscessus subsp. abscessus]
MLISSCGSSAAIPMANAAPSLMRRMPVSALRTTAPPSAGGTV